MSIVDTNDIAEYQEKEKTEDDLTSDVMDNLTEWSSLITELSHKEHDLLELKDIIFDKEQWIVSKTDFKTIYGKNNAEVRKLHLQKHMNGEYTNRRNLELSIDYLKRRISFLKQLIHTKTIIMECKE